MDELVKLINSNKIGVCMTDTIYGIVGSAFSKKVVSKIYKVKRRSSKKPLIILMHSLSDLKKFKIDLSKEDLDFLEGIWPDKVSVIFPCRLKKFEYLHRGSYSLAFRIPKKKSLRKILEMTGPLVAPSANIEGESPVGSLKEAKEVFGESLDFYYGRGGKESVPSTILSYDNKGFTLIREGAVKIKC